MSRVSSTASTSVGAAVYDERQCLIRGSGLVHIFSDIRVVDFTQVLSGPTVTRLLAEMGADVIKVELAPDGDPSRSLPYIRDGRSGYFIQQNRGKRSVCLDVQSEEGHATVERLIASADVVVENFSPGVIERLGFGYDSVAKVKPEIIMCSISAFGRDGPLSTKPGYDGIAQAYSGVMHMNGHPGEPPSLMMVSPGDVVTGVHGAAAISAALFHRERTGEGQYIELSLLDSYVSLHEINIQAVSGSRGELDPTRSGSHHYSVCPYGIFTAKDGYVLIAVVNDREWARLCSVMERPELVEDARFVRNEQRRCHRAAVVDAIEEWLAVMTVAAACEALDGVRVPAAPILSVKDAIEHPHVRQRRVVRRVPDPVWGEIDIPGVPFRFSRFPEEAEMVAGELGEHTEEVLAELDALDRASRNAPMPDGRGVEGGGD